LSADKLVSKARNETGGTGLDPEILLLRQPARRGSNLGNGPAIAGAGVIDHGDIAELDRPFDGFITDLGLAESVQCPLDIVFGYASNFALYCQALIFGQLKLRRCFDRRGKLERLAAIELYFLDIRIAKDIELLLVNGFLIRVGNEFTLYFGLNVFFEF